MAEHEKEYYQDEIDLREIILVLFKWKWLIIGITIAAIIAAVVVTGLITPVYQTSAKLKLGNYTGSDYTNTTLAAQVLTAPDTLQQAAEKADSELSGQTLSAKVTASPVKGLNVIDLTIKHSNPEEAAAILNKLMAVYAELEQEDIADDKANIEEEMAAVGTEIGTTQATIDLAKQAIEELNNNTSLSSIERAFIQTNLYSELRSNQETRRSLSEEQRNLQENLENIKSSKVLTTAVVPNVPVKPNGKLNVAIAAVLGLMAGVFLAFAIEYFKDFNLSD
ncbi:Wzz/FepE/Etk N-terminal domain-containing protein [Metallumcola ferriviriculae]|uniref:Wzz/FepE/Etk N-terminal domain-containing protein n=1 Tax=Metallumcola ferriviriculae TaxID=3039180 RepID=A0AAU0UTZ9_9FIRM|nr:Wzz/FepE/Etk N-terminal domain-containing protein [Desulfitibacteraceae bacterium MK1]